MSFNKRFLPELPELIKIHEKFGNDKEFVRHFTYKTDSLSGPSDSFAYFDSIQRKVEISDLNQNNTPDFFDI